MAEQGIVVSKTEERTEGKNFGPVVNNQMFAGALVILIVFICGSFGLIIPAEVAQALSIIILIAVGWWTKGRKTVVETRVEVPTEIQTGTGKHRADPTLGDSIG